MLQSQLKSLVLDKLASQVFDSAAHEDTACLIPDSSQPNVLHLQHGAEIQVISEEEYKLIPKKKPYDARPNAHTIYRRFHVLIANMAIQGIESQQKTSVFFVITFGGTCKDYVIQRSTKSRPSLRVGGYPGNVFVSPVVTLRGCELVDIPFYQNLEWYGSTKLMDTEMFRIEIWKHNHGLNELLSAHEDSLKKYIEEPASQNQPLNALNTDKHIFDLTFNLFFQEIYDFEINLCGLRYTGSPNSLIAPRIEFRIPPGNHNKWPIKVSTLTTADCCQWEGDFLMMFRGTVTDLENTPIKVKMIDGKHDVAKGILNIGEVLNNPNFSVSLASSEDPSFSGKLLGQCGIPFRPKYRQQGSVLEIDSSYYYLLINLMRLDRASLPSYVEALYDGKCYRSTTSHALSRPTYNCVLVYKLCPIGSDVSEALKANGEILVDVWGEEKGKTNVKHLGWISLDVVSLLSRPGRAQIKRYFDKKRMAEVAMDVNVINAEGNLRSVDDTDETMSNLFYELWIQPSTIPDFKKRHSPTVPVQNDDLNLWKEEFDLKSYAGGHNCFVKNERKLSLPVNMFVQTLTVFHTARECFNFVRAMKFVSSIDENQTCFSGEFLLRAGSGNLLSHNTLLCSLLSGTNDQSKHYVCWGTNKLGERHSWVTSTNAEELVFWDLQTSSVFIFNLTCDDEITNSSISSDIPTLVTNSKNWNDIPYDSIDLAFNSEQIYGTKGTRFTMDIFHFEDNPNWFKFYRTKDPLGATAPTTTVASSPIIIVGLQRKVDHMYMDSIRLNFYNEITKALQSLRFQVSRVNTTRWLRPNVLTKFLEQGAEIIAEYGYTDPDVPSHFEAQEQFQQWKAKLDSSTPEFYKLRWSYMYSNSSCAKDITDLIWESFAPIKETNVSLSFALGIHIVGFVNNVITAHVVIVAASKIKVYNRTQRN